MKKSIRATLKLEEVAEHFKQWRSVKQKRERIPDRLWSEAVSLVGTYGISQVTRTLHLSGTDLNKRRGIIEASQRQRDLVGGTAFVEIDPAHVNQSLGSEAGAAWMELERPDGLRLRIQPTRGADMLALVERFMEVGSCYS